MKGLNGMKSRYLKKQQGEKVDLDIQVENNYRLALYFLIVFITVSCSVSRKVTETDEQTVQRNIDYTLYDLTYVEGIKQKMKGNFGEAIDKFEDAIEINPESDAANYQISRIAALRRDYENALKYGNRAAMIDKKNNWYMMNMANIYIQQSKLDSAAVWLEKSVELEPENENEKFRLGNIYMQTGMDEKAEEIFEDFNSQYQGNEQILLALINVKLRLGKYGETEEIIKRELEKNPENLRMKGILAELYDEMDEKENAERLYDEIIDEEQNDLALDFSYIDFLLKNKQYEKLIERTNKIILSENTAKEDKIELIARIMQDSLLINNYPDKVVELGKNLIRDNNEDPTIVLIMAEIYETVGNTELEIRTLTDYIAKHEEQYFVWEKLLLKLNESNDIDKLYTYAERAAKLFNKAPLPKTLYAYGLIENSKYDEALEELRKVRILVNNEEQYLIQILSLEAEIAYRQGDIKEASEKFDRALGIEPGNTLVLNNYAYYLAEKEIRLKEAQDMIEKCLSVEENITYLDTYAWVLYKRGKYRESEKVMIRIFESGNIEDGELIEHSGLIKKAIGKCEDAIVLWQTALRIDEKKTYLIEEIRKCIEEN